MIELAVKGSGTKYKHGFIPKSQEGASSHYHGYPNEWHGPKRKYDNSRRKYMGNHGGGIPEGGSAGAGQKGVSEGSANHNFSVGDHVHVHAGVHTGIEGKVKRLVGLNHVHIVPKSGRAIIAHAKNVAHGSVGVRTKHAHVRVG